MRLRCLTLAALAASLAGCSNGNPSAPTPSTPAPGSAPAGPNRAPEIVATMTPTLGIDQVTTFTARVEVKDPDGDPVSVTLLSLWQFPKGTPVELNGGVGVVSFKTIDRCGPVLTFTATDSKGATARAEASAEHRGLAGTFRLTIGDDFYSQPYYAITLAQSGTGATGTLSDYPRTGVMDLRHRARSTKTDASGSGSGSRRTPTNSSSPGIDRGHAHLFRRHCHRHRAGRLRSARRTTFQDLPAAYTLAPAS